MDDDDEILLLEKQFCPPIDTALFFAICSDYDLSNAESIEEFRTLLKTLKESVADESNTSFDPSGTGGGPSSSEDSSHRAQSWRGDPPSEDTEFINLSKSVLSLSVNSDVDSEAQRDDDARRTKHDVELEELSVEEKNTMLLEMFPTKKAFDVGFILKKVGNNFGRAVEELLNHAFLEEEAISSGEPILKKGIDGFAELPELGARNGRRGKRKKEAHRNSSTLATSATSSKTIIPHYLPRPRSPPPPPNSPALPFTTAAPSTVAHSPTAHSSTARLISVRSTAFAQASAAHRKSKSTPLMGGAASYYSALGREASTSLQRYEAAAADALVLAQSRAGELDLHGVTVKDAVRIAQERVERWWGVEGGGEWARAGRVMGPGFRIVTGVGRHSEGGRGRLGPAVGAMLLKGGWRVEVTEGVVTVVGRARR